MAYIKIALLAAIAALASAQTQEEIDELNVILNDVKSNLQEYISLAEDSSSGFSLSSLPSGVLDIGLALASATDDSYTTLYSEVDFAAVSKMLTMASSSAVSSAVASSTKASAISQISDGQVQATSTVSEQTENGAAKAVIGMGAGVMAAAAMLL
ncbi:BAD_HP_G0000260.mRNA.1.CDS.1 [Saccharomyces cerevisiae]|nr:BAD_HP_G0000260.mRNA.1.CDS.1 [Saccharomyces cerevisiae]CAI6423008.1 BAD_HP_G0000260.mRNA.1.CDS.1 [Saccharomyces cerevisiae]